MRRKELARELVREYMASKIKNQGFDGFLVWIENRGAWNFTTNTSSIMINDGRNIQITADVMNDIWQGASSRNQLVIALDSFLGRAREKYAITALPRRAIRITRENHVV